MSWTPDHRPTAAAKAIPIFAEAMGLQVFALSQAKTEFAENHLAHGKSSTRSSKVKPLNYHLSTVP